MWALVIQFGAVWLLLLPLAAAGALGVRYLSMRRARSLGLLNPPAWRLLRWALVACGVFWLSIFLSSFYETSLLLPLLASLSVVAMALLVHTAKHGVHPGLHGFHWPFPKDGIELVERERQLVRRHPPLRWWIWRLAPIVPMAIVLTLPVMAEDRRWLIWSVMGVALLAPILLIPYRNAWLSPLLLLLVPAALAWQALNIRSSLPEGMWVTPWSSAQCSAGFAPAGDGTAWCTNVRQGEVYRYHLATGVVQEIYQVPNAWEVTASGAHGAWVRLQPSGRLIFVSGGEPRDAGLGRVNGGALTENQALWYLDGLRRLRIFDGGESSAPLRSAAGLLDDTALVVKVLPGQAVWVGSSRGASHRDPETGQWQRYGRDEGIQGAVIDITAAQDGTIWLLHSLTLNPNVWWASALHPNGEWTHYSLGRLSGLAAPRTGNAIAADGLGRLWFTAESISQREKFLGVLNPDGTLATPMLTLGSYPTTGPFFQYGGGTLPGPYGLLGDGAGGIYLYNGEREPVRHWQP